MKLHNSSILDKATMPTAPNQQRFIIRYHQSLSYSVKNKDKKRYPSNDEPLPSTSCLLSQADATGIRSKDRSSNRINIPKTDRPHRRSLKSPNSIASVVDLINSVEPVTSREKEVTKQFPRIPIEYNDEKANGSIADYLKLKVIYRGYAPKNTYFFLKSLAFQDSEQETPLKRGEYELSFESKFESGNLSGVARKSAREFYLFMRQDTNTNGLRQWFYFVVGNKKPGKYKFRIYKFSKFYSLYKEGMKPFVRVGGADSQWRQSAESVKYEQDNDYHSYYLEFEYEFQNENMCVEFATQPPYTYSMLKNFLKLALQKYDGIRVSKAGQTFSGLDIPKIQIISKKVNPNQKRKVIIVTARTHPAETSSNWTLQSFIDRIFQTPQLKLYFDFYIIPMVNPDGVFLGNHRTGVLGQDINRKFTGFEDELYPEVQAVQKLIESIQADKEKQIQYLIDLHGHSARRNIFAYGDDFPVETNSFLQTHILPKLLSEQISTFKYNYCVFRPAKQKKSTARVFLSRKYKINAITFEQSYGLIDDGAIGIQHWRNFGTALADSLKQYYEMMKNGSYPALQKYLAQEILYQRQKNEKRAKKKLALFQELKTQSNIKDIFTSSKTKTEFDSTLPKLFFKQEKYMPYNQEIPQRSDDDSVLSSQLSSGDQDLQNNQQGIQLMKKQLLKIGCLKDCAPREMYNIASKNIEIKSSFEPRLHQQRSSIAPRILKFQMRKRQELGSFKFFEQKNTKKKLFISEKEGIELPNLRRER